MIRCYITDRRLAGGLDGVLAAVARNVAAGTEWIQVREKDLSTRALAQLVRRALRIAAGSSTRILVNSRVDVALACGAHGVHLPADAIAVDQWRRIVPAEFLMGVSCHTVEELQTAAGAGADYALYAPVFSPLSKQDARPALGLEGLAEGCRAVALPVLALGGITWQNAASCMDAGAAGVAGITLFQTPR